MVKTNPVVEEALSWIGTPYHHQGSVKGVGADCLGLVRGVFREVYGFDPEGVDLNYAPDWGNSHGKNTLAETGALYLDEIPLSEVVPGDVLLMRYGNQQVAKHVLIKSYGNRAIHSINNRLVSEIPLSDWWTRRLIKAFRFKEE